MRNVDEIIAYHAKLREAGPIPAHRDVEGVLIVEVQRLRAELAAEKMTNGGAHREYVRCQRRYEIQRLELEEARSDLATIRASNAAPPQPCSYPQYCGLEVCNCPRDAAPPHVEPSAVVNWKTDRPSYAAPVEPKRKLVQCPSCLLVFGDPPLEHVEPSAAESEEASETRVQLAAFKWNQNTDDHALAVERTATEARMLELARVIIEGGWPITTRALELATLVIETFGVKK